MPGYLGCKFTHYNPNIQAFCDIFNCKLTLNKKITGFLQIIASLTAYYFFLDSIHLRALTNASCHGVTASVMRRSSG